jgi:phage shock protein B
MHDASIIAIIAIVFGCLTAMVKTIVRAATGGGKERSSKDPDAAPGQRELYDLAMRLQSRVETLERLLDASQPEWRGKP